MNPGRVAGVLIRTALPAAVLAISAAVISANPQPAFDGQTARPTPLPQTELVTDTQLACPGPEERDPPDVAASVNSPVIPVVVSGAATPAEFALTPISSDSALTVSALDGALTLQEQVQGVSAAVQTTTTAENALVVRGTGGLAPGLAADQTAFITQGDQRGLASVSCQTPNDEVWLVGGGGEIGRRGRVMVLNSSQAPARVVIDVFSGSGVVPRAAGSTVTVGPLSRAMVLLDAIAPRVTAPVLRVRSTGAPITATLHDTWLEGTTPRGSDGVTPAAPPARQATIPGVSVAGKGAGATTVRLAVPGSQAAVVQLKMWGAKGPTALPGGGIVRVPGGTTAEFDLSDVPPGYYGIGVSSDTPVVAGAIVERRRGPNAPGEFAWTAAAPALDGPAGLPSWSARFGSADLVLTAPGPRQALITVASPDASGETRLSKVTIPAATTIFIPLTSERSLWVTTQSDSGPVVAARVMRQDDKAGQLITTYPVRSGPSRVTVPNILPAPE
ncbi:MAG: DUF5719 family protein [Actinomycetota bacterium]